MLLVFVFSLAAVAATAVAAFFSTISATRSAFAVAVT